MVLHLFHYSFLWRGCNAWSTAAIMWPWGSYTLMMLKCRAWNWFVDSFNWVKPDKPETTSRHPIVWFNEMFCFCFCFLHEPLLVILVITCLKISEKCGQYVNTVTVSHILNPGIMVEEWKTLLDEAIQELMSLTKVAPCSYVLIAFPGTDIIFNLLCCHTTDCRRMPLLSSSWHNKGRKTESQCLVPTDMPQQTTFK